VNRSTARAVRTGLLRLPVPPMTCVLEGSSRFTRLVAERLLQGCPKIAPPSFTLGESTPGRLLASSRTLGTRPSARGGQPCARSVLVVSHHLDGFLLPQSAGLLHPAADPGVHRVSDTTPLTCWFRDFPSGALALQSFPHTHRRSSPSPTGTCLLAVTGCVPTPAGPRSTSRPSSLRASVATAAVADDRRPWLSWASRLEHRARSTSRRPLATCCVLLRASTPRRRRTGPLRASPSPLAGSCLLVWPLRGRSRGVHTVRSEVVPAIDDDARATPDEPSHGAGSPASPRRRTPGGLPGLRPRLRCRPYSASPLRAPTAGWVAPSCRCPPPRRALQPDRRRRLPGASLFRRSLLKTRRHPDGVRSRPRCRSLPVTALPCGDDTVVVCSFAAPRSTMLPWAPGASGHAHAPRWPRRPSASLRVPEVADADDASSVVARSQGQPDRRHRPSTGPRGPAPRPPRRRGLRRRLPGANHAPPPRSRSAPPVSSCSPCSRATRARSVRRVATPPTVRCTSDAPPLRHAFAGVRRFGTPGGVRRDRASLRVRPAPRGAVPPLVWVAPPERPSRAARDRPPAPAHRRRPSRVGFGCGVTATPLAGRLGRVSVPVAPAQRPSRLDGGLPRSPTRTGRPLPSVRRSLSDLGAGHRLATPRVRAGGGGPACRVDPGGSASLHRDARRSTSRSAARQRRDAGWLPRQGGPEVACATLSSASSVRR